MSTLESSPSEAMRTGSAPLSLDHDQRLNLYHTLYGLSTDLRENPFAQPFSTATELKGIKLPSTANGKPGAYMAIETAVTKGKTPSASVSMLTDGEKGKEQFLYHYRPSFGIWEEWQPGASEPRRIIDNPAFMKTLEPQLPRRLVEFMVDYAPQGVDIARLLGDHLRGRARTRKENFHYKAHGVEVGDSDFTRDTDFIIRKVNSRVTRSLFVAASLELLDYGEVRKTYGFNVEENRGSLVSAEGMVRMSAQAEVSQERLNAFAQRDEIRNDASYGISIGTDDIRNAYGITEN